jgi:hypothetical protein
MTLPRYGYLQVAIVTFASFVLSESTEMAALSLRGQQYSKASYNRGLQNLFHPVANPGGIVSFSNAENASVPTPPQLEMPSQNEAPTFCILADLKPR